MNTYEIVMGNLQYDKLRKDFFLSITYEQQDVAVKELIKKYVTKK